MIKTCATCEFSFTELWPSGLPGQLERFICRRYPPSENTSEGKDFVNTKPEFWCGEYKAITKLEASMNELHPGTHGHCPACTSGWIRYDICTDAWRCGGCGYVEPKPQSGEAIP
jgi:hypothetical protein